MTNNKTANITNDNLKLLQQYGQYLNEQGKPHTTIESYILDLKQYFNKYDKISKENILEYKQQFKEANTINRKLTSLKRFNLYLIDKHILDINELYILPTYYVRRQKQGNPLNVTDKQVEKFFERVNNAGNLRDIAIIYLIANTGIRREECTNVLLDDLDLGVNELTVYGGKENKQRELLINNKTKEILEKYIAYRNGSNENGKLNYKYSNESNYLFVSQKAYKLNKTTINDIFHKYKGKNITPHQLRHYWATVMLETETLDIRQLQDALGHESINTTEIYTHTRKEIIKKKINKVMIG
jgi:site-specific recombinase XerD